MSHSFRRLLLSCVVLLAAALSVTNPVLGGGSPAGGRPADNPVQAVRGLIHSYYYGPQGQRMQVPARFAHCFPMAMRVAACPLTPRFLYRLRHPDPRPAGCLGGCTLDPVSRSENTTQYLTVWLADNNGSVAHVNTRWSYTYDAPRFTFVVRRAATGWLVDDEYCTGHPAATMLQSADPALSVIPIPLSPAAFRGGRQRDVQTMCHWHHALDTAPSVPKKDRSSCDPKFSPVLASLYWQPLLWRRWAP